MPAGSTLTLAYWAWVGETLEEQTITNTLQAEAADGSVGPEEETLDIEIAEVFLPLAMKDFSLVPPAFLEDHFDAHADNWTPFLNYWRLNEEQWYWDAEGGYEGGGYRHNKNLGGTEAHDALGMYLQEGSQEWTDYRFQAKVNLVSGGLIGLWFRGTYVESATSCRHVGSYYLTLTGSELQLWQMQTEAEQEYPGYEYCFHSPMELTTASYSSQEGVWYNLKVEVEGSLIKCYVNDVLLIEYNDTIGTTFLQGTVGFLVYKAEDARFDDVLVEPF